MRFTKKKRNQVYRKALEVYGGYDDGLGLADCLCYTIVEAADELFPNGTEWGWTIEELISLLPEFFAKKPEGIEIEKRWWPNDSLEWADFRVKILEQLIEETK